MPTEAVIIFATFQTRDEAERVGEALVERRLAACGNVIPSIHSFYFWEGRMQRESEAMLLLKTTADHVDEIGAFIRTEGSHDTPEVISVAVSSGLPDYLAWVVKEVGPEAGRP